MADMIDAKDAKKILNCDDAALNNHVNSGSIRAQRVQGKLMLNKEDVDKLSGRSKDDEGTIVLTGDSDDLSIDLGKVVDDSAETIVQNRAGTDTVSGSESITFGDELEVVSFDDRSTSELTFDETKQTGDVQNLSFTDSNTAVMTAVDETSVGATTAPIDFQTNPDQRPPRSGESARTASSRRSARSQRARSDEPAVHWIWPTLLVTTMVICAVIIVPYFVIELYPAGDQRLSNGDRALGVTDNVWTTMASALSGFTVDPNKERFTHEHPGTDWVDLSSIDNQAKSRYQQFLKGKATPEERTNDFIIVKYDADTKKATSKSGAQYDIHDPSLTSGTATTPGTGTTGPAPTVSSGPMAPEIQVYGNTGSGK